MSNIILTGVRQIRKLIASEGTTCTLSRVTGATLDPIAGTMTGGSTTTGVVKCIIAIYEEQGVKQLITGAIKADNGILQAFIQGRLRKVIIDADGAPFEPVNGDTITGMESATWEVLGCNPVRPAGTPLIYEVAVRRK